MEPLDCNYKIISIDSVTCSYPNPNICEFYVNLDEPLRNVFRINIITLLLNINNSSTIISSGDSSGNLESIYVDLNSYHRLISKGALESNGERNNIYFFDSLVIEKVDTTVGGNITIKNDYNTTDSIYYIDPIEPQLKRFTVRLLNKNNVIINKSAINRFIMKIGVYYNNKKSTRL
jgi:hypothetical protein